MMKLILLLSLFNYSGTSTISMIGKKGSSVTLPCEYKAREIFHINLISQSKIIPVCPKKNCIGQVLKKGACDVFIKDLSFSHAGKYILNVYYHNDQAEVEPQTREYQLRIQDEISVKIGEKVTLDVLSNADEVVLQNRISTEWTEVWKRGHGVRSDRLTVSDGNLIISNFTVTDAGTYIVLDYEGEILITVTVTESGLTEQLNIKTDDIKKRNHWVFWGALDLYVLALAVLILSLLALKIKKMQ